MGIIAVCLATLRPLFRVALERTIGITHKIGSGTKGSRTRPRSQPHDKASRYWAASSNNTIKMNRLDSRSEHSDSSGIAFGTVTSDYQVTTTVEGNLPGPRNEHVLVKSPKVRNSRDDEMPILSPPIIYKTSEVTTERNFREMV